jgi:hypothetical protein
MAGGQQHSVKFESSWKKAPLEGRRSCGAIKVCWDFVLTCRYRFSGKPISTYIPLLLARLCGEWQLVNGIYELVSGNYKARGVSGGKYEAQIVIFCILATINRFSCICWKAVSR